MTTTFTTADQLNATTIALGMTSLSWAAIAVQLVHQFAA